MSESENKETGKLGFGLRIRKMLTDLYYYDIIN